MTATDDTIVAISSPPGHSPRGLIRLSGPNATAVLASLTNINSTAQHGTPTHAHLSPRQITFGPQPHHLPVLDAVLYGPKSYTGQDTVEIQAPGNPAVLHRLLRRAVDAGARLAEPGEFSYRAYLSGKMDLTQAEGVAATIAASSESQLKAARALMRGELKNLIVALVDELTGVLALIEAGIDFTDQEDVVPIAQDALQQRLTKITNRLDHARRRGAARPLSDSLPRVVLAGPPNVGKSTLFNALLNQPRAVTSPTAGTTRDVLEEPLTLTSAEGQRIELLLIDIAGIDNPERVLDRQAQDAAEQATAAADLVLTLSESLTQHSHAPAAYRPPEDIPTLRVRTKSDLMPTDRGTTQPQTDPGLTVCAQSGQGMNKLQEAIAQALLETTRRSTTDHMLHSRHEAALSSCLQHLQATMKLSSVEHPEHDLDHSELIAAELRLALDHLGGLTGTVTPDDVIGRIFQTFCIGK